MNRTDILIHDCCTDDACEGRKGWVTCDSAPFDANLVADILDANDDHARRARLLARFGADAIDDDALAMIYDRIDGGRRYGANA